MLKKEFFGGEGFLVLVFLVGVVGDRNSCGVGGDVVGIVSQVIILNVYVGIVFDSYVGDGVDDNGLSIQVVVVYVQGGGVGIEGVFVGVVV